MHRSGFADAEYIDRHASTGAIEDKLLPVSEAYLVEVLQTLELSGLHIKQALEARYPGPPTRRYLAGDVALPGEPEHLLYISFVTRSEQGRSGFADLSLDLGDGKTLKNIVAWISDDGRNIRMLIGGDSRSITALHEVLRERVRAGSIKLSESLKVKR